jgi:hypothetical protein
MPDRLAEGCSPLRADPGNFEPFGRRRIDHRSHIAEMLQERRCAVSRDAGHRCEHRLGRLCARRLLRVTGTPLSRGSCGTSRKHREPERAVFWTGATHHIETELGNRQEDSSYGLWSQPRSFEVEALDQEVAAVKSSSHSTDLRPKSSANDCRAKVSRRLPLDDGRSDDVVPDRKWPHLDKDVQCSEVFDNATLVFEDIDEHRRHSGQFVRRSLQPLVAVQGTAT